MLFNIDQQVIREEMQKCMMNNPTSMNKISYKIGIAKETFKVFMEGQDLRRIESLLKVVKFVNENKDK